MSEGSQINFSTLGNVRWDTKDGNVKIEYYRHMHKESEVKMVEVMNSERRYEGEIEFVIDEDDTKKGKFKISLQGVNAIYTSISLNQYNNRTILLI